MQVYRYTHKERRHRLLPVGRETNVSNCILVIPKIMYRMKYSKCIKSARGSTRNLAVWKKHMLRERETDFSGVHTWFVVTLHKELHLYHSTV